MGDTTQTSDAANTGSSQVTQLGTSTGSVASGAEVNQTVGDTMTSSGAATTTTGAVGSDAHSTGNLSNNDNDNKSSAQTGAIDNKSSVGPVSTGSMTGSNEMGDMTGTVTGTQTAKTGDNNGTISGRTGDVDSNIKNDNANLGVNLSENTVKSNNDVKGTNLGVNLSENTVKGEQTVSNGSSSGSASNSGGNKTVSKGGDQAQKQSNDGSGNSANRIDASNNSNYKSIFIPTVTQVTPPSTVAIGNMIKETTACGAMQSVVQTPILGVYNGLFRSTTVKQGFTYDLAPYTVNGAVVDREIVTGPDGVTRAYGHQAIILATVVGISGNRNIQLGGGGNEGAWGQGGMGSSSAMTQLVTNIQLVRCELGAFKTVRVETVVEVPAKKVGQ